MTPYNRWVKAGIAIVCIILSTALFAPWIAPNDPFETDLERRLKPPDHEFPLGTDSLGRCVLSRLIHGSRVSIGSSLATSTISITAGILIGLVAGMSNGWLRSILKGIIDIFLSFPGLILVLAIVGTIGASIWSLIFGIAGASWAWWARFISDIVIVSREKEFVIGGRLTGVRGFRLIRRYILPQVLPLIMVTATLKFGWTLLAISGLSYLGLGPPPPVPEWGSMVHDSQVYMLRAPWMMMAPGVAISMTVLGFNLVSEGFRDALQIRKAEPW